MRQVTLDLLLLPFLGGMTVEGERQVPHPSKIWLCDAWRLLLWMKRFEEGRNKNPSSFLFALNPHLRISHFPLAGLPVCWEHP